MSSSEQALEEFDISGPDVEGTEQPEEVQDVLGHAYKMIRQQVLESCAKLIVLREIGIKAKKVPTGVAVGVQRTYTRL